MTKNKNMKSLKKVSALAVFSIFILPIFAAGVLGILTQTATATLGAVAVAKAAGPFTSVADLAKKVDLKSFVGKPVRVPIPSENPDKVPGGDQDFLYVYPPQFFMNTKTKKLVSLPLKSVYLASGKQISAKALENVKTNVENQINYCFCNQDQLLKDLADVLKKSPSDRLKSTSFQNLLKVFNLARRSLGEGEIAHAAGTNTNATDELNQLLDSLSADAGSTDSTATSGFTAEEIQSLLDSDDPQMKQLLMLLLLNLLMSQKLADASNVDKQTCLDNGGEWINEQCTLDETDTNDNSKKQAACEDSDGTWKSYSTSRALCLNRCGNEDADCKGTKLADFEEAEGIIIKDSEDIMGCKCPTDQCSDAEGKCIATDTSKDDDDEDDVPNSADKCADSSPDGSGTVNKQVGSQYYGCTCSQIQAMGGYQQQITCPPGQCNGPYWTQYTAQPGSCNNGQVTPGQCVADNSGASNPAMAQQCYQQDQQKQNQNAQQQQDMMKQLQDMLKQLGQGGQKGGDKQGGGDQKGCGNQQGTGQQPGQGQPSTPTDTPTGSPTTPSPEFTTPTSTEIINPDGTELKKYADGSERILYPDNTSLVKYEDGTWSYYDDKGKLVTDNYRAGKDSGFFATDKDGNLIKDPGAQGTTYEKQIEEAQKIRDAYMGNTEAQTPTAQQMNLFNDQAAKEAAAMEFGKINEAYGIGPEGLTVPQTPSTPGYWEQQAAKEAAAMEFGKINEAYGIGPEGLTVPQSPSSPVPQTTPPTTGTPAPAETSSPTGSEQLQGEKNSLGRSLDNMAGRETTNYPSGSDWLENEKSKLSQMLDKMKEIGEKALRGDPEEAEKTDDVSEEDGASGNQDGASGNQDGASGK